MKMTLGKATSVLLALLMILTTIPIFQFTVSAAEATEESIGAASGTTGKCTWTLENGVLTIIGNGAMGNYSSSNYAPWKGNKVKSVIIENGVTNIGNYAFDHCEHLTSITISDSVTSIGEVAFSCCSNLTSVTIPDYVTGIGRFAFIDCSRLTSVNIPNSVTSIGNSVFKGCRSLTSVDIPDSVTSIGSDVFSCSGLSNITVNNNNTNYCSIDGNLYDKNATVLIQYATGKTDSSFITPDTVTSIGDGAFRGCSSLTNVTILNSVTSIGDYVFESCENLISVTISESVTSIGRNAFYGCSSLINVTIPNSVTSIDKYAFFCCTSLTSVDIPDSVISIGYWAFKGCSSLTSVYIPESVTMIGREAFSCRNISNISVDNNNPNYLSIDGNLYYKNKNAISLIQYAIGKTPKSFLIPDYVTGIGYRAFDNCSTLTDVTIPSSVISIGEYAFYHCDNLKSITIPNSVESIGEGAFQQCKSLTDITIPNSVTSISNSAFLYTAEDFTITGYEGSAAETFANNYGYTFVMINEPSNYTYQMLSDGTVEITGYTGNGDKISIPSEFNGLTVTSISNSAFVNCKKLTAVTIPNSVINISDSAFKDCSFLTSVDIPNSVTVIGDYVFSGCVSLSNIRVDKNNTAYCSIDGNLYNKAATIIIQYAIGKTSASFTIPDSVTSISSRAFSECNNLVSVTIPYFVANICDRAFLNCHNLSNITIPNSVINIDECAFLNCNNLTSLTIPKSVSSIGEYAFGYNNYESGFVPDKVDDFTITGYRESVAEIYANENGFNFLMVDDSCDFEYKVCDNGTAEITKYKGNGGIVTIPSIIDGYAVTSLGYLSFSYCTNLSSVYIPDSVINIGARAFYSCNNLATVNIPKSVTNIDFEAFYQCYKLSSVTIPDSVTIIRQAAFSYCSSLITVNISNSVTLIDTSTFLGCTSLTAVTIPDSVTTISSNAFSQCTYLEKINIPADVKSISNNAFDDCQNLSIYGYKDSFAESYAKTRNIPFVILNKKTACGTTYKCKWEIYDNEILSISCNGTMDDYSSGSSAPWNDYEFSKAIIEEGVTNIGDFAFYNNANISSVKISDSVTNIGIEAFNRCTNIKNISLPDSITSIGDSAFYNCTNLESVTIPDKVTYIGKSAFYNCTSLKRINIPNSVIGIGNSAFDGCESLVNITIPNSITSIEALTFNNCTNLKSVIVSENLINIGYYAFKGCSSLTSISLPASITTIEYGAFCDCQNLTIHGKKDSISEIYATNNYIPFIPFPKANGTTGDCTWILDVYGLLTISGKGAMEEYSSVTSVPWNNYEFSKVNIEDGVTNIEKKAFQNCEGLLSITIPESVTHIDEQAFEGCPNLTIHGYKGSYSENFAIKNDIPFVIMNEITADGITGECTWILYDNGILTIKGNGAMEDYSYNSSAPWKYCKVSEAIIEHGVTNIGSYAFNYCYGLTSITIPDSVISIGDYAFSGTFRLTSITIPDSVTSIGNYAFNGCLNDTDLEIPYGVKSIGDGAFYGSGIKSISIPESVTSIGKWAFFECRSLKTLEIPKSITEISWNMCTYCSNLENVTIPDSVTIIYGAFQYCSKLKNITIPDSVTKIDDRAFSGCWNLESIIIPSSVTRINSEVFYGCTSLKSVTIPNSVTRIDPKAFYNCSSLTSVTLPDSVTNICSQAFYGCTELEYINIPNSVIGIGSQAFYGCTKLDFNEIPDSVINTVNDALDNTKWYLDQPNGIVYIGNVACCYKGKMPENASLMLREGTVSIAAGAFKNFKDLKNITLPDSLTSIGAEAFYECTNLENINIPNNVTSIYNRAFYGCVKLVSITIPNSVTHIGIEVFKNTGWYNSQLDGIVYIGNIACAYKGAMALNTSLTLKEETVSIAEGAFKDCTELKKIMVPKSVKIIGAGAFSGCTNLTKMTLYNGVTSIGSKAFENCKSLSSITIPDSVTSIGYYAFNNCALTSVTIPPSVISIGEKAFGYNDDTKVEDFKISAVLNSRAYTYANENGFSAIEYKTEMPNFKWGTDNWSFCNNKTDPNSIKDENVLKNVLNQVMSDFNITNDEQIIRPFNSYRYDFRGSCFGMTVSEILFKQNLLELSDYIDTNKENCKSVYQCRSDSPEVISLIGFIHVLQNVGSYGQKIRAAESNTTSQSDFISELESKLTNGNRCVVIGYSYYSNGKQEQHAVLGYGIDDNNSEEYDKRILIADPNCLSENGVNDNACIYYKSEDKSWVCPYWDNQKNITCHWNNTDQETNTSNTDTGKIDFIMRFNSLTDVECFPDNATGDYISGITIFNDIKSKTEVEKVQGTGEVNAENTETDSGITPYSIADGNGAELFALRDSTAKYSITCNQPSNFSMIMDYEKVTYFADVEDEQPISLLVKPDGCINLEGDKIKYSLTMMTDNLNNKSDWYSITVSGSDTNNVTLTKKENVYILETDTPGNVTITAENADEKTTFSFKTSKKALIFKNENTVCVIADTGENGEFETVVNLVFDVNSDCSVDIRDVTDIQKYLAEMPDSANLNLGVADMDNDGKVGIEDATQLQLYLAELI